jgi:hypothetical protein
MLKNEKTKFFLSIIVVLIISGALIWQGVFVINAKVNNSISELKEKKISKEVYTFKGTAMEKELADYEFSKSKIEKINDYFVYASDNDDTEFTSFFGQLDNIALLSTKKEKSLVIELYQVQPVAVKKTTGSASVPKQESSSKEDSRLLRLTLKSDFEGLLKFISYLEAMPYYVYIESININVDNSARARENTPAGSSFNLQSSIIIKVFRKTTIL